MAESAAGRGGETNVPETAEVLPELRVKQFLCSSEPLSRAMPLSYPEEIFIQPYGDYTLAIGNGISEIQVFDEKARRVEDIQTTSTMIMDWPSLSGHYTMMEFRTLSGGNIKAINDFPEKHIPFLREYMQYLNGGKNREGTHEIPKQAWQLSLRGRSEWQTVAMGEGYIILHERYGKNYIVFQTQSSQGTKLLPINWKRFDTVDGYLKKIPEEITSAINTMEIRLKFINSSGVGNYRRISNYDVLVYKDRVDFVKEGNSISDVDCTDKTTEVGENLVYDSTSSHIVYYCSKKNPTSMRKFDASIDAAGGQLSSIAFPQQYETIIGLQLDPSNNFFTFESSRGEFVILSKDGLKEIKRIPNVFNGKFDNEGRIRGVDEKGHLVVYDIGLQEFIRELSGRKIAGIGQELIADFFKAGSVSAESEKKGEEFKHLESVKTGWETQFRTQLETIAEFKDMSKVTTALDKLKAGLIAANLSPEQIKFLTEGIESSIRVRQQELAMPIAVQGLTDLNGKLSGNLTIALLSEVRGDLAKLKSLEGLVDAQTREKIIALEKQLSAQSTELFRREGPVIAGYGRDIVERETARLQQIVSKPDFDDWQEHTLPQQLKRLGTLISGYPPDAPPETLEKLMAFSKQLRDMSTEYGIKFKEQYAEVRQKGSAIMAERIGLIKLDMGSLIERLREKGFKNRTDAETYVGSSEALGILRSEIAELAGKDPDAAQKLDLMLKVQIANIMFEIERGGLTTISETGQQMETFGNTQFPKWEGEVHEKTKRQVDIIFIPDEGSKGPGVTADKIMGDVGIIEINSRGKVERRRLYEGLQNEDAWKYGGVSYLGRDVFPSYVTNAEFRQIKKDYAEWNGGKLKQQFNEKRKALRDLYATRQTPKQRTPEIDNPWKEKYKGLLDEYAKFAAEHHILLFNRIDQVKNAPETAFANGKGFVEEWQNYWVRDSATEGYLEEMAQIAKMQLEQQSGILTIRGNPGAGKDVLVSMFSNRTNRPYFATDCSKWDTPYEFSEDIVLESINGASQTAHVPSTVLNGITTPGAIVYFNEIHALTAPAQIFLHALTDAKRRITLKTSSGKVIKALDTVVLMASMNPQVKDPDPIEPALRDRMVFMDVDYPPLYREKDPADPNPNSPIDASESLRIAREVKSLQNLTIEQNMDRNEFVRMWDKYVNGVDNGANSPSKTQEFDMNVILAIVQFANKLRENFVAFKSRNSQIANKALPVSLPATGRPLRDCAYALSSIPDEQKIAGNPEAVARTLLERWFLSKIDNLEERGKIKTAMATWTSSKRPAAN